MKLGYRLAVLIIAWAMRRGVTADQARTAVAQSFGWRDAAWREGLVEAARLRNRERVVRSIAA